MISHGDYMTYFSEDGARWGAEPVHTDTFQFQPPGVYQMKRCEEGVTVTRTYEGFEYQLSFPDNLNHRIDLRQFDWVYYPTLCKDVM